MFVEAFSIFNYNSELTKKYIILLLKNCKRAVFLDADIYNFLQKIIPNEIIYYSKNIYLSQTNIIYYHCSLPKILIQLKESISKNKKIFICVSDVTI